MGYLAWLLLYTLFLFFCFCFYFLALSLSRSQYVTSGTINPPVSGLVSASFNSWNPLFLFPLKRNLGKTECQEYQFEKCCSDVAFIFKRKVLHAQASRLCRAHTEKCLGTPFPHGSGYLVLLRFALRSFTAVISSQDTNI